MKIVSSGEIKIKYLKHRGPDDEKFGYQDLKTLSSDIQNYQ